MEAVASVRIVIYLNVYRKTFLWFFNFYKMSMIFIQLRYMWTASHDSPDNEFFIFEYKR